MSNSTTTLDLLAQAQAGKEITANALFDAASPAMLYGRRQSTTSGLVWGYYGGVVANNGALVAVANGALTLAASATNYIEATAAGVVSTNTTGYTAGRKPLYTVVTGAGSITSYTDHRCDMGDGVQGLTTLVAGAATVVNAAITANSRIFLSVHTAGGTQGFLSTSRTAGTGFSIASTSSADTSTIAYLILEAA